MIRAAIFLALIISAPESSRDRLFPNGSLRSEGRVTNSAPSYALFEFAPADGTGMGAACACTTPTGAKGETLTFTRASAAYCTKGNETSGIVNGDLVECASGQPRVMPGGDGTGGLGLSVWEAQTNVCLRSQEFDNAAWVKYGLTAAAPTVTADFALSPVTGATTADRVQFAATGAGEESRLYQGAFASSTYSWAVYVKGNGTSGTVDLCTYTGAWGCQDCAFNATTWTRCVRNASLTTTYVSIGNQTARAAADVLLWQADVQNSPMSPPIATAGTAATRVAETAYLTLPTAPKSTGVYSAAVTVSTSKASSLTWQAWALSTAGASPQSYLYNGGGNTRCGSVNGTTIDATRAVTGAFTDTRIVCFNDGTNEQGIFGGVAFATPAAGTRSAPSATRLLVAGPVGYEMNGTVKSVCIDSDSTRCR